MLRWTVLSLIGSIIIFQSSLSGADQPLFHQSKPFQFKLRMQQPPVQRSVPPPPKRSLPQMIKPFGMPGVVGFQNGKWEGTDYLGYLVPNIEVDIEVLSGDGSSLLPNTEGLKSQVKAIFEKEGLVSRPPLEGPPLPFLHLLLIVYPVDKDKYVVFGASRLFEQIQVMRKNFTPAGFWQGITWENQDVILVNSSQLETQVRDLIDKLSLAFAKRYRQYNPDVPDLHQVNSIAR